MHKKFDKILEPSRQDRILFPKVKISCIFYIPSTIIDLPLAVNLKNIL